MNTKYKKISEKFIESVNNELRKTHCRDGYDEVKVSLSMYYPGYSELLVTGLWERKKFRFLVWAKSTVKATANSIDNCIWVYDQGRKCGHEEGAVYVQEHLHQLLRLGDFENDKEQSWLRNERPITEENVRMIPELLPWKRI
jgi:hypothetical protein